MYICIYHIYHHEPLVSSRNSYQNRMKNFYLYNVKIGLLPPPLPYLYGKFHRPQHICFDDSFMHDQKPVICGPHQTDKKLVKNYVRCLENITVQYSNLTTISMELWLTISIYTRRKLRTLSSPYLYTVKKENFHPILTAFLRQYDNSFDKYSTVHCVQLFPTKRIL